MFSFFKCYYGFLWHLLLAIKKNFQRDRVFKNAQIWFIIFIVCPEECFMLFLLLISSVVRKEKKDKPNFVYIVDMLYP